MKKILCTFANDYLTKGFPRFKEQAESMKVFDEIIFYTQKDLGRDIRSLYGRYYYPYSRGYGFWSWKPYLLMKTLDKMEDGDILLYTDLGCFFNPKGRGRLLTYFDMVNTSPLGMLAFRSYTESYNGMPETLYYDYQWTKGDVFDYFGVRDNRNFTHTTQVEATVIFIRKCKESVDFVREWYKAICTDTTLISDQPSRSENIDGFVENRHDQSLYSILVKKYDIPTLSTNEIFPKNQNWALLEKYPIWAMRDKYYKSKLHYRFRFKIRKIYDKIWSVKYFLKKMMSR